MVLRKRERTMKILIDADACPVIPETIKIAKENEIEVIVVSDFNHELHYEGVQIERVAQGNDFSDHHIFQLCSKNDIVITSDGGLANLILGKQAIPISFNGFIYNLGNIDRVLMERYLNAKARKAKQRGKNIPKRTKEDDENFIIALEKVIKQNK